ncbi:hypothetical protein VW35_16160 [Devosia soli]|uniref:DUF6894 domain-containing protein n=1 Tax=Devosia soli TaxID=361041 RepID=A0A0F5L3W6_9HYPH|nr:hypothetical protein [Devosia soli]KKB76920.1 hypothetical protein VW35_16160 [Devosia soli]
MPLFYFDFTQNDVVNDDTTGQELADLATAKREAVKALAEIAAEEIPRDGKLFLSVTVCDHRRDICFTAKLTFEPS